MSNFVLVVDTNGKTLAPCKPGTARSLLKVGKASIFRQFPFTIILKKEVATPAAAIVSDQSAVIAGKLEADVQTTGITVAD